MTGITGLGTTYNLPNYTGVLYMLTPQDTPFYSAIGGLSGGGQTTSKDFEWQTEDLRAAGQNTALEGADAPTEQERVRGSVNNITQIHHETVGVSYTKLAAVGAKNGINNAAQNPVTNELDHQVTLMLKQMIRDVEWSLLRGIYQSPVDNTTPRKTRGLLAATVTNVIDASVAVNNGVGAAAAAATDLITATAHALANDDQVLFTSVGTAAPLATGTIYYVVASTANSFSVALTKGGAAVNITADGTVTVRKRSALVKGTIDDLCQMTYNNGGITESATATLIAGSAQKRAVTAAYSSQGYVTKELTGNVGGVNVTRIETDFGVLNVMLDRHMPDDVLQLASLEQCMPVYLETPGKGHFFAEPLAKTGSKDRTQLYGEVGLAYGNEMAHGKITGLKV